MPYCGPKTAGWLVHTNHFTHPRMAQYERNPRNIAKSVSRYDFILIKIRFSLLSNKLVINRFGLFQ